MGEHVIPTPIFLISRVQSVSQKSRLSAKARLIVRTNAIVQRAWSKQPPDIRSSD